MKYRLSNTIALVVLAVANISIAQGVKDAQPTLKIGNWTVLRSIDMMTDKVKCTGCFTGNDGVQLVSDSMYVRISGGIQAVTPRFGVSPAKPLRIATGMEKKVGVIVLHGNEFTEATQSNRLRLEVLTLVSGVATLDLDISGIQSAVDHIKAGCPASADNSQNAKPTTTPEAFCSEQLEAKLRAAGVAEQQISTACRQ